MSGDLLPGAKLPTTQALMANYGVTNQTVQRSLAVLKQEGFLIGRAGSGVYVRENPQQAVEPASYMPPSSPGEPHSWVTEAAKRNLRGEARILEVGEARPPAQVRDALGLPENGVAVMRHRLMLLNGQPAELIRSYYPVEIARGTRLADRRRIPGGSPTLLTEMGMPPVEFVDRISVRLPTSEEFVALELPDDVPVLRTFRIVFTVERRPIEASVLVKAGHVFELEYRLPAR
ncbi:GntR family transcriptional regulator [Longispora fulva]|uniref:GntR family transcriptional regulator n=2 Tax=Longispora fulva TaxID=619741 RepID=A0A8J7KSJ5_9ACTN|nr:GntR family transcriptional regulator [Longispora fulva]